VSEIQSASELRSQLAAIALRWQERFGIAPAITSVISELDAALRIVGMSENEYCLESIKRTAVKRGWDFKFNGVRYQVKANRPSGKPGSLVTKVAKANNYEWDKLIWMLYDKDYELREAWEWDVNDYRNAFDAVIHVRPRDMRRGRRPFPLADEPKNENFEGAFAVNNRNVFGG
jgi:hypothetical protein